MSGANFSRCINAEISFQHSGYGRKASGLHSQRDHRAKKFNCVTPNKKKLFFLALLACFARNKKKFLAKIAKNAKPSPQI